MALIPYQPFRRLEQMRKDLDRYFPDFSWFNQEWEVPRIDVYETDTEVVASCEIPGVENKDNIQIDVHDQHLTISGVINRLEEQKEENFYRKERFSGRFQRTVQLPAPVSSEGTQATYKQGILEVRMPKQKQNPGRRIDIQFH